MNNDEIIYSHLRDILAYIGDDPTREGLIDTPKRIVKSWKELFCGYQQKAEDVLNTTFNEHGEYDSLILLKDIDFTTYCEHHFLMFSGKAHVGYIPNESVVGLSKLARLVELHAKRLQIQEKMTTDIANDLHRVLRPLGVAVVIEAHHSCMGCRGIRKPNASMLTSSMLGVFRSDLSTRQEFLDLIK